jgi:hypothetical protein
MIATPSLIERPHKSNQKTSFGKQESELHGKNPVQPLAEKKPTTRLQTAQLEFMYPENTAPDKLVLQRLK